MNNGCALVRYELDSAAWFFVLLLNELWITVGCRWPAVNTCCATHECCIVFCFRNCTFYLHADALNPVDSDLLAYLRVFSMDHGQFPRLSLSLQLPVHLCIMCGVGCMLFTCPVFFAEGFLLCVFQPLYLSTCLVTVHLSASRIWRSSWNLSAKRTRSKRGRS